MILRWLTIVAYILFIVCFALRFALGDSIDENGILHEPFYLVGLGYLFLGAAICLSVALFARARLIRNK